MDISAWFMLLVGLGLGGVVGAQWARGRFGADAARLGADAARLASELEHARSSAAEKIELLAATQTRMAEQFKALSADALAQSSQQFLQLAETRMQQAQTKAAADLDARKQAVEHLVKPLTEVLGKVETQLVTVEKDRTSAYAALRTQVEQMQATSEQLRTETASLVTALRAPQVRGKWGELQLRRVVEGAGMVEHCDFTEQQTSTGDDGALRPDLVVRLADGKQIVVDAKVPFAGFIEAMDAKDDATRAARLRAHARHLRDHIDQLAAKAYWERFTPTPEFVVLFVPADAFLQAALEQDPTLFDHAFERNVVLATPSNLIAIMRTIGYTWRQEALAANAQKVFDLGRELHGRLAVMGRHLNKLGGQLESAVKSYNDTVASVESRVLVTARRFTELKVTTEELAAPAQLSTVPRQVQAPELVASATDSLLELELPEAAGS
ncbi:MAG: DNA recombination protein RmuC [Sporichthyaceae bacterium]|nr:DNA recombination protein RmuC [Sporichthyaceae bacterium]